MMKILQIVNRIPYPLNDGGNLAVHFYMDGFLKAGVSLSLLAMNTTRHWVEAEQFPPIFKQLDYFQSVRVDNRIRILSAMLNLFSNQSYHVSRFISKDFEKAIIAILKKEQFDIIQLEGLYLTPYLPVMRQYSQAKIVLRQHNAEFLIWERFVQKEKNIFKKGYLKLLTRRLKAFEQRVLNRVDFLLPISQIDAQIFKELGVICPIFVQSYGLDLSKITFAPASQPPISIYHIGALDWQPNQEAVYFFINEVLPKIVEQLPDIQFHLAGRNMPKEFYKFQSKNIQVYGEVPDAEDFERDKSILVVPLHSGGGVRIKIFRAMAMGKAIVATKIGMEGIEIMNGQEGIIVSDAQTMADQIIHLAQHPETIESMGKSARLFMEKNHNQSKMVADLLRKYEKLIGTTAGM